MTDKQVIVLGEPVRAIVVLKGMAGPQSEYDMLLAAPMIRECSTTLSEDGRICIELVLDDAEQIEGLCPEELQINLPPAEALTFPQPDEPDTE